jgi:2-keto-myo-inositol isomerase
MRPCISQATTLSSSFADDIENYSASGCRAIEVWLTKLEQHLEHISSANTRKALAERDVQLVAAAYQGGLLLSADEERRSHFDHFRRRLDLCQTFGIRTLLLAADFAREADAESLARAVGGLAEAGRWAAGFDIRLALEFRGGDAFCTNLDTAIALVEACREPNVGICLDAFHFYKGPSKREDLERLTPGNLFHVQVCDVAGVPRELMTDSDRVMPGDGDFRLDVLFERLRSIDYTGAVSLELMNPDLWRVNPKQVVEVGLTALERVMEGKSPQANSAKN